MITRRFYLPLLLTATLLSSARADLEVDLKNFRRVATQKLAQEIGRGFEIEGIYFRDGFSDNLDQASLFMAVKPKSFSLNSSLVAYVAGLNGTSEISIVAFQEDTRVNASGLIDVHAHFYTPTKGNAIIPQQLEGDQLPVVLDRLQLQHQGATFKVANFLGILTFESTSLIQTIAILKSFSENGITGFVSGYVYPSPSAFSPVIYLGKGLSQKVVNINQLRSLTSQMVSQYSWQPKLATELNPPAKKCSQLHK